MPLLLLVTVSWMSPPRTTVAPLGIVTVVVKRWLLMVGTVISGNSYIGAKGVINLSDLERYLIISN